MLVSLDISNAFNTVSWKKIREAMKERGIEEYIIEIMADYFQGRKIQYRNDKYKIMEKKMTCGVLQGSALGPLLWNLVYDVILGMLLPVGCSVIGYADDTILIVRARNWKEAKIRANLGIVCIVAGIRDLGLKVSAAKTEATWMRGKKDRKLPNINIKVEGELVKVGKMIKYLGLTIDEHGVSTNILTKP